MFIAAVGGNSFSEFELGAPPNNETSSSCSTDSFETTISGGEAYLGDEVERIERHSTEEGNSIDGANLSAGAGPNGDRGQRSGAGGPDESEVTDDTELTDESEPADGA